MSRLRIISGEFGGRFISADVGRATQPMGDRVRSALFNMVDVQGKKVLDAYAGSGAIGLEALSRGAEQVDFVENDKKAQRVIAKNIKILDVDEKAKLYKISANAFISIAKELGKVYDIVFVDPPYKLYRKQPDGTGDFSTALNLRGLVKPNGLMIISCTTGLCVPTVNGVVVVDKRSYGEAALVVLSFLDDK